MCLYLKSFHIYTVIGQFQSSIHKTWEAGNKRGKPDLVYYFLRRGCAISISNPVNLYLCSDPNVFFFWQMFFHTGEKKEVFFGWFSTSPNFMHRP